MTFVRRVCLQKIVNAVNISEKQVFTYGKIHSEFLLDSKAENIKTSMSYLSRERGAEWSKGGVGHMCLAGGHRRMGERVSDSVV